MRSRRYECAQARDNQEWPVAQSNAPRHAAARSPPGEHEYRNDAQENKAHEHKRQRRQLAQRNLEEVWRESPDDHDKDQAKINSVRTKSTHYMLSSVKELSPQLGKDKGDRSVSQWVDSSPKRRLELA
jgi:hypothetical protein